MFAVAKPFNSINRRFQEGDPIMPLDIAEGSAMNFEALKKRGFVVSAKVDYTEPVPAPSGVVTTITTAT